MRQADTISYITGEHSMLLNMLERWTKEVAGTLFLLLSLGLCVALATWQVGDPSLTHATTAPVHNWLGKPGAIVADMLMQLFGLGAVAVALVPFAWSWRLLCGQTIDQSFWRGLSWMVGLLCVCGFAAAMPTTPRWPLPTGLGGYFGDSLILTLAPILPSLDGFITNLVVGAVFLALSMLTLGFAMAIIAPPYVDGHDQKQTELKIEADTMYPEPSLRVVPVRPLEGGEGHMLGWLSHLLLSFKTRILLLFGIKPEPLAYEPPAEYQEHGYRAHEPQFEAAHFAPEPQRYAPQVQQNYEAAPQSHYDEQPHYTPEPQHYAPQPQYAAPSPVQTAYTRPVAVTPAAKPTIIREPAQRVIAGQYQMPPLGLLALPKPKTVDSGPSIEQLEHNARMLEQVLDDFGVKGDIIHVKPGPVVTLYELQPAPGIKSSRVIGLADDIARSMSAVSARVAVVPGRNVIGIELPNAKREVVLLREMLAAKDFIETKSKLALCLGKTIGGESVVADLARMPHLLIAGTTGSGKSVAINTMILSLLYRMTPEQCRMIMIDPKMLELSIYDGIPHLLAPVVTDPKKAVVALKWTVKEMEGRYKKMSKLGVRNIDGYNVRVNEAAARGEALTRTVQTGFDAHTGQAVYESEEMDLNPLPYIVVVVDEMADLMMVAGKEIEGAVQRLAQMARAAGIHIIMATQRPSVDVITGTIKANFPTRISFQVTSKIDSRTILGEMGAEQLLGQGDMLHMAGGGRISRVHGPFVADDEVEHVVQHLKAQGTPDYLQAITEDDSEEEEDEGASAAENSMAYGDESGDLYDRAVAIVLRDKKPSTSYVQRRLGVGYNKAASLIERMEKEGIISAANGTGKREILVGNEGETEPY